MREFLEIARNGERFTLEIKELPCKWLEITDERGGRVHAAPDREAILLFITENLRWEILHEYRVEE